MSDQAHLLVRTAAARVRDPLSGRSLVDAGLVAEPRIEEGLLCFKILLAPELEEKLRNRMLEALGRQLREAGWEGAVQVEAVELPPRAASESAPAPHEQAEFSPEEEDAGPQPIPGVAYVVAVASGKGGVGKSTVAIQLAFELAQRGHRVGILDADIYGPSLPTMLPLEERPRIGEDGLIVPPEGRGIRCMSVGFMVGEGTPIIWRGPVVMGVIKKFVEDVAWGPLDYLVEDLPPGTGDAQLTLAQNVPMSGAVIVSTPQELALLDAVRGLQMFRKLEVPILGVVENMAWYELPDGSRDHPFGQGGARRIAQEAGVDLLAEVPLDSRVRVAGDSGRPEAAADSPAGLAFRTLADAVAQRLPVG